jgi:hypothetical protein
LKKLPVITIGLSATHWRAGAYAGSPVRPVGLCQLRSAFGSRSFAAKALSLAPEGKGDALEEFLSVSVEFRLFWALGMLSVDLGIIASLAGIGVPAVASRPVGTPWVPGAAVCAPIDAPPGLCVASALGVAGASAVLLDVWAYAKPTAPTMVAAAAAAVRVLETFIVNLLGTLRAW